MTELVILVGFRGTGKTTIGRALAEMIDYEFFDTDAEIVRHRGDDVADIVKNEGWSAFRRYEKEVLASLTSRSQVVVATGGGAVLHEEVWPSLGSAAEIVWLTAAEETIMKRLSQDKTTTRQRPALAGCDPLSELPGLLRQRLPLYRRVAHHQIDTGVMSIDEAVAEICRLLRLKPR